MAREKSLPSTHHEKIARKTHEMMLLKCERTGVGRQKKDHRDGYVLITTIASFIWAASSAVGGDPIINEDVDVIRRYLKYTGNVVNLGEAQLAEGKKRFRIWVGKEWQEPDLESEPTPPREPDAIDKRAERLQPSEVGEDREPAPVLVKTVSKSEKFPYRPKNERTRSALFVIVSLGELASPTGEVNGLVRTLVHRVFGIDLPSDTVSHFLGSAANAGYIKRDESKPQRCFWVKATDKGVNYGAKYLAKQLAADQAMIDLIRKEYEDIVGSGSRPKDQPPSGYKGRPPLRQPKDEERQGQREDIPQDDRYAPTVKYEELTTEHISRWIKAFVDAEVARRLNEVLDQHEDPRISKIKAVLQTTNLSPLQMLVTIEEVIDE